VLIRWRSPAWRRRYGHRLTALAARPFEPLADSGSHLILDLAGLRFCDCAGLTLFLRIQQHARAAGGSLQLAAPTASVRRLITMTRLSGVLVH
jgi:anti-sigma B factor antagonist